jgi:hypothetical protein
VRVGDIVDVFDQEGDSTAMALCLRDSSPLWATGGCRWTSWGGRGFCHVENKRSLVREVLADQRTRLGWNSL